MRRSLCRRIQCGDVAEFALCSDNQVKYRHESEHRRVLKVEFQNGTTESAVYHFPLTVEDGKASVAAQYFVANLPEKLL